jgi:tricarballylate dehydrogenase
MGSGLTMALAVGAMPCGHWSGAHAGLGTNAPPFGEREIGACSETQLPIWNNGRANGERFVDEAPIFATTPPEASKVKQPVSRVIFDGR